MLGCFSTKDVPGEVTVAVEVAKSSGSAGKVRSWNELHRTPLSDLVCGEERGETSIIVAMKQRFPCGATKTETIKEIETLDIERNTTCSCTFHSAAQHCRRN